MEFNSRYLGHNFESWELEHYITAKVSICTKCNIIILHEKTYIKNNSIYFHSLKLNPNSYRDWAVLNITCDEMIIKNIIE